MKQNEKFPLSSRLSGSSIPALFRSRIVCLPLEFGLEDCSGTPFKSFDIRVYDDTGDSPVRIEDFPVPLDWYNNALRVAEQAIGFCSGKARFVISFSLEAPAPEALAEKDMSEASE